MDIKALLGVLVPLILFFPAVAYVLTVGFGFMERLERLREERADFSLAESGREGRWAEQNGFEFSACYVRGYGNKASRIAVWRHRERPMFFYAMELDCCDPKLCLTTLFADRAYLSTGTSSAMFGLRSPPWAYHQVYGEKPVGELWEQHLEGENYLMDVGGAELIESDVWFEEWFVESREEQRAYMRSIPFWPFRVWEWIFLSIRRSDVSIQKQHERGWIRMPNERGNEVVEP